VYAVDASWLLTNGVNKNNITLAEPIILALDTSCKTTSLAVARGGSLLESINELPDQKRSETLWTEIEKLLAELGMTIGDVDVFSVCVGPGGFTGLRVGMAAVMGFSAATDKPVAGITSLEGAAFAASPAEVVCPILNAYKGEFYSQLFSFDGDGMPIAKNDPMVSTIESALERISGEKELVFAGDAAEVGSEPIRIAAEADAERMWTTYQSGHGLAEDVARLAFLKYKRGDIETGGQLKACYVRPSEAEIKLSLGLLGTKIKRSMRAE
jgi:tRNA threonylcarbamoyladenosine biosynthesis protein TsaB